MRIIIRLLPWYVSAVIRTPHDYYYAKWNGHEWKMTFLANAGGHFHQTPNLEKCYSAGMAIDPSNTNHVYCSLPVDGNRESLRDYKICVE